MELFFKIDNIVIQCINRHFESKSNFEATFNFLYDLHNLQDISEDTFKYLCIHLYLKLN